jgi:DNA-binding transcriptional MocR family regulator
MRAQYLRSRDLMVDWVSRYFPAGTRVSRPQGSFMLWVEMPQGFDSQKLNRALLPHKIQIAPGSIFSAAGKYRNCIRLNYAEPPSAALEAAVKQIGTTIAELIEEADLQQTRALGQWR